jgi:hypothetical protein
MPPADLCVIGLSPSPHLRPFVLRSLAGIGLYGLISFLVAERTLEIDVRMAIGATPREIAKLVVSDGVRWTAAVRSSASPLPECCCVRSEGCFMT